MNFYLTRRVSARPRGGRFASAGVFHCLQLVATSVVLMLLAVTTGYARELPGGWSTEDIGDAAEGYATSENDVFTVFGSGADVWGSADAFRFVYTTLKGDGSIVTQVTALDWVHEWTKAGVMMRETLGATSKHAFMLATPGKGLAFQRRAATGAASLHTDGGSGTTAFLKLTRSGNTFTAYTSPDGYSWRKVGSTSINMHETIYIGLAVTSHADGALASATFENTAIQAGAVSAPSAPSVTDTSDMSTLRVVTWNTHHGGIGTDGRLDRGRFVRELAAMRPDVVALNEVESTSQAADFANRMTAETGLAWDYAYDGRGNVVMTWLPVEAQSVCVVNGGVGRKAVHLSTRVNGRRLNVWSVHLATDTGTALPESRAVRNCASEWSDGRLILGDFNGTPSSAEVREMWSDYEDAWVAAKAIGAASDYTSCDGCTYSSYRIDYVFASRTAWFLALQSATVVDARDSSGHRPSDHRPLLAVYSVY